MTQPRKLARRDIVSRYLGTHETEISVRESAEIHLGILLDMKIKLSQEEIEHLFALPTNGAIERYCRTLYSTRL